MLSNIYAPLKMAWHAQREGFPPAAPKQVQLILSDLCNQDCSFCHPASTMIWSTSGNKRIADIEIGDRVTGPDGGDYRVTQTGKRYTRGLVCIGAEGRYLTITPEHEVLTMRGWLQAKSVCTDDWIFTEADNHYRWGVAPVKVESAITLDDGCDVYSIDVEDIHSYIADGFVVHNCAYRMSGYSSNELFVGDSKPAAYGTNNPVRFIPTDRALRFIDEFKRAGVLAVQFTGGGEPTVHPDHESIFARTLEAGLSAALVSNGLRWSDRLIDEILPGFAWVRVSIDAGHADTYGSIRRTPVDNFHKVVRHAGKLAVAIQRAASKCVLGIGYVVTTENYKEIVDGVAVARGTGARYIRLSAMFNPEGESPYLSVYDEIREAIHEARVRYESQDFSVVDLFGERIQDLHDGAPDYRTCSYQHYTTYVGGDMRAYRCCVLAYNHRGLVAGGHDLSTVPFDEFWASQERVDDMAKFDARGCERCQFNEKNRAMAYLTGPAPDHVEFP